MTSLYNTVKHSSIKDVEISINHHINAYVKRNLDDIRLDSLNCLKECLDSVNSNTSEKHSPPQDFPQDSPKFMEFEKIDQSDIFTQDEETLSGFYQPKEMILVPYEWRRAVRIARARPIAHTLGEWIRSWVGNIPSAPIGGQNTIKTGPWLNQWWQGSTYFYVDRLKHEVLWRELFFDLVFVVLIANCGERLDENINWTLLADLGVVLYPIWAIWLSTCQMINIFHLSENLAKMLQIIMLILATQMGDYTTNCLSSDPEKDTTIPFITIFMISRFITVLVHVSTAIQAKTLRKPLLYRAILLIVCGIPWIVSAIIRPTSSNSLTLTLWWISTCLDGILFYLFQGVLFAKDDVRIAWNVQHWVERLHLFVLVTFGEFVSAAIYQSVGQFDGWISLTSLVVIIMVVGLAWCYFSSEENTVLLHAMRSGQIYGMLWTMLHFYFVYCIIGVSSCTKQMIKISQGDWKSEEQDDLEQVLERYTTVFSALICLAMILSSIFSILHITVFEMGNDVLNVQEELLKKDKENGYTKDRTQRYFFPLKWKWIRFGVHIILALLCLISGAKWFGVNTRSTIGFVAGMICILVLFEEISRTLFHVQVEYVEDVEKSKKDPPIPHHMDKFYKGGDLETVDSIGQAVVLENHVKGL